MQDQHNRNTLTERNNKIREFEQTFSSYEVGAMLVSKCSVLTCGQREEKVISTVLVIIIIIIVNCAFVRLLTLYSRADSNPVHNSNQDLYNLTL